MRSHKRHRRRTINVPPNNNLKLNDMKLVITFTSHEIAVPIIREGKCYNFFLFSVIEKDTRRFVKFSPRNAIIDVAEIRQVFSKKRGFFRV